MDFNDISQLIRSGKPALALHALQEWEKDFSRHPEPLLLALQHHDAKVIEVVLGLAEKYHPAACGIQVSSLLKSENALIRRLAVQAMVPAMGKPALEALRLLFVDEQDVFVLASAVTAAARLNAGLELVVPFMQHPDIRLRANAVRAAAALGKEKLPGLLEPFLNDTALRVQNEALKGLATLAPETELEKLVLQRLNSPDAATRAATIFITGELPLSRRVVFLINALTDVDHRVSGCAIRSLAILRDPLGIRALIEAYLTTPDTAQATSILRQLKPEDSERIVSFADGIARPVTAQPLLAERVIMAAAHFPNWEPFLPWILGAANRKEPHIRQTALKIIAGQIEFFRGNINPLIEKAENSGDAADQALAALIKWKAGHTDGLSRLQNLLFSLKSSESEAALKILQHEKGLIAKKLLTEAAARGIRLKDSAEQAKPAFKLPDR